MTDRMKGGQAQRQCAKCGQWKYRANARSWPRPNSRVCTACQKRSRKHQVRKLHVTTTYNITLEEYEALKARYDGACHACREKRQGNLCVDHDHKTGLVRGLLCRRCNRILGLLRDNAEVAYGLYDYLRHPPAVLLGIHAVVNKEKAERPRRGRGSVFR